jgi:hypothetical protein
MTGRAADKIEGALRTRTFSWVDPRAIDAEGRQKSGLEFLRAGIDAKTPKAPIAATLDFVMTEAEAGRVLMTAQPQESTTTRSASCTERSLRPCSTRP